MDSRIGSPCKVSVSGHVHVTLGSPTSPPHWILNEAPKVQKHRFWVHFSVVCSANFWLGSLHAHAIFVFSSAKICFAECKVAIFGLQKLVCLSAKIHFSDRQEGSA